MKAKKLGETQGVPDKINQITKLLKDENHLEVSILKGDWRQAKSYLNAMLYVVPDSLKHTCKLIEVLICTDTNDMTEAIRFCTSV